MKFEIRSTDGFKNDEPEVEMLTELGVKLYNDSRGLLQIEEGQTVEIEDLDELLTFCKEFGDRLVVETDGDMPSIEIYNGWRE